jgi:hypothetical protein
MPKVEEWEAAHGEKWNGTFEEWEGEWDERIVPSFNFFLTAYDSEEDESEIAYLDDRGRIKLRYFIRVTTLAKQFVKQKQEECMKTLSELNMYIESAQYYRNEMIQDEFKGSESDFQEYLAGLLAKRSSQMELKLGKMLFTSEVISHIRERIDLPQHVILHVLEERRP